jgi:hypothetical protein
LRGITHEQKAASRAATSLDQLELGEIQALRFVDKYPVVGFKRQVVKNWNPQLICKIDETRAGYSLALLA